ncbi:putative acetyltransferase YhhY [Leclercia adecarboxylata]|uniref:Putative acetyltransferase YhhY n=1 Tax=Leclercia adecarboxylata TaxID=83655 RepID=A0A4V6JLY6_9ENTR|nr:putative acetyltransferase YhhY [Leclercia adecarboxylata]
MRITAAAVALYQRFGFEIEGTGRKFALRNGEYVDAYYMARMKVVNLPLTLTLSP